MFKTGDLLRHVSYHEGDRSLCHRGVTERAQVQHHLYGVVVVLVRFVNVCTDFALQGNLPKVSKRASRDKTRADVAKLYV